MIQINTVYLFSHICIRHYLEKIYEYIKKRIGLNFYMFHIFVWIFLIQITKKLEIKYVATIYLAIKHHNSITKCDYNITISNKK